MNYTQILNELRERGFTFRWGVRGILKKEYFAQIVSKDESYKITTPASKNPMTVLQVRDSLARGLLSAI